MASENEECACCHKSLDDIDDKMSNHWLYFDDRAICSGCLGKQATEIFLKGRWYSHPSKILSALAAARLACGEVAEFMKHSFAICEPWERPESHEPLEILYDKLRAVEKGEDEHAG